MLRAPFGNVRCRNVRRSNEISALGSAQTVAPMSQGLRGLVLVTSLARPGGNVTGIEPYVPGLPAKQMEFARELVTGASRVGLLSSSKDQKAPPQVKELE